jgi:L-fuculose-phosphate aldolase
MNKTAAEDIVHLYQELVRCNMNHGSSGNVSCREADRFLITPTGATATSLAAQQLVEVPLTGTPQPGTAPSSEWAMHAAVYAACPEAGFVVHTHADAGVSLHRLGLRR